MSIITLNVNTTFDENDGNSSGSGLSLRDAIITANNDINNDYIIQLQSGQSYFLTVEGNNENAALGGDLDIINGANITITTNGSTPATISAGALVNRDRVLDVLTGGALSLEKIIVTGGLISSNNGGGISNAGTLNIVQSNIQGNSSSSGGGVYSNGTLTIANTNINNNSSSSWGGGVYSTGTLTIANTNINNNSSFSGGGGIYMNSAGTIHITNTTIDNNSSLYSGSSDFGGGGIYSSGSGNTIVVDSTISNNSANSYGGGVYRNGGIINIANTTISSNSANDNGGGIYYGSSVTSSIINVTIANNLADANNNGIGDGGGIFNNSTSVVVRNTIVAGNFDTPNNAGVGTKNPNLRGSFQGNLYNLIGDLTGASGTIGTGTDIVLATGQNAGLGPLQNNGGFTKTHALLSGSPAINAGNNGLIPLDYGDSDGDGNKAEAAPNDQRRAGFVRINGGTVDIGAFEVQSTTALPTLAINDVTITEGNSGTTNATFTVTRTGTATNAITVNYATANGTTNPATAGSDYTNTTGTLTFATNETTKTITVPIIGDTTVESNETFFVNLSSATNATITDSQGLGTITNDDSATGGTLLIGDDDDNYLIGGSGNDTLQGLGGNDTLNGATGADSLVGDIGNDTYFVDNSGDVVSESTNGGTDTVISSITYTLPANVENLFLSDSGSTTDNINGTGNTLNNKLTGNSGANTLTGDAGNDSLNGGKGNDTLNGGAGNDTYTVESLNDVIIDSAGVDLVKSSVSLTLATGLENLTLIGSTAINGTGNSVNNLIIGNTGANTLTGLDGNDSLTGDAGNDTLLGGNGNDTLVGGVGNDSLTGGSGLDFFRFNAKTEGIDTITDFVVVDDTIQVAKSSFAGGLVVGTLLTTQFTLGASATTTAHRFGYDSSNGKLWFDVDGSGATAATQIATLPTGLALTNADIVVV